MRRALVVAGVSAGLLLVAAAAHAAFTASSRVPQTLQSVADFLPPTASRADIADLAGNLDKVTAGAQYYVYAQVADQGNPPSGVQIVTADLSAISGSGATAVSLVVGSWTVGGQTYNYRSAVQTASTGISGSKAFSLAMTDALNQSATQTGFSVTVSAPQTVGATLTTSVANTSAGTTASTSSITTTNGTTYLVLIHRESNLTTTDTASISGPFSATSAIGTANNYASKYYVWAFLATGNGASGAVTVTFNTSGNNAFTTIDVVALSGNNTATPVAQNVHGAGTSTTATAALTSPSSLNGQIVVVAVAGQQTITVPSGFTQIDYLKGGQGGGFASGVYFNPSAQASSSFTLNGSKAWGTITIEINHG